jgi:predicted AlkP superfamily phosphohydrolase/phosphomutase
MGMRERDDEPLECNAPWSDESPLDETPVETDIIRARQETEREIQEWVDQFDYGPFNPVFKVAARIQKALGLY